jgi:chromosomal replication initiator protein
MEPDQLWQSTLGEMEVQLSKANFTMWLKNSQLIDKKDGTFVVALPNNFAKQWVEEKYQKNLLGIMRGLDGSLKKIEFIVTNQDLSKKSADMKKIESLDEGSLDLHTDPITGLNSRYTLSSYVVGPSNELAFAAAEAIIGAVGKKYNPFFIYGGVGLGKTHLIQAMGNEILTRYNKKIRPKYVPSEQFTRDVVWGIKNKRMEDVKKKYRDIDVLIVDDIQFIAGKEKMQEEFFHTFNTLYENNKQIIISSDKPPQSIATLEDRLRSRFEGGFVADISFPEYEVRIAIIKSKLQEVNRDLTEPIIDLIARRYKKNIRELEGILKKILFQQERKGGEISEKAAEEIIERSMQNLSKKVSDTQIIKAVAEFFSITTDDLISHNRRKEVVEPRQIAMYLLRDISELSYPHIGEKMGRDHTTAIHSYEKINQEINRNPSLNQKILLIKESIFKS